MARKGKETNVSQNPNILRVIPSWRMFFLENSHVLQSQCVVLAQGGTVDSVVNQENELTPIDHSVNIPATEHLQASEIAKLFTRHVQPNHSLGALYPWSLRQTGQTPWIDVAVKLAGRISSFDSGQESNKHFAAGAVFDQQILKLVDKLVKTQGTDSLVDKATLEALLFTRSLVNSGKKIVAIGAATPGYEEGSDAGPNINAGIYAVLEKELPGGVYIISSQKTGEGNFATQILPALGSVKLHSDGTFYAPNSGPLLTILDGIVYIHPLYHEMKRRIFYGSLLPDLPNIYLENDEGANRLQKALDSVALETVKNDPSILDKLYESGKRAFVIKARGAGNGTNEWREKIAEIINRKDTTVMIITLADSGDVNLKKYAAGLNVSGVLSGRTLREEAACMLTGIIHDLKVHSELSMSPQKLIELVCYLSGMVELPTQEIPLVL